MRFFKYSALICATIAIIAGAVYYSLRPVGVKVRRVRFPSSSGATLIGDLYLPQNPTMQIPVLLCHGVEANKEVMGHLGVEFAKRGYPALAFDYGGYGESSRHNDQLDLMVRDSLSALVFLLKQPEVKQKTAAGMVGHSMGVTYSVETAAISPVVSGVVGLGNEALAVSVPPKNVALAMGIYDAFHTLPDMLDTVRESSGNETLAPNEVAGDFAKGNARTLITSPYSDHGIEPVDPLLIRKSIEWIGSVSPGANVPRIPVKETCRAQARFILFAAGGAALAALLVRLLLPKAVEGGKPPFVRSRAHFFIIAAAGVAGNFSPPSVTLAMTDISLAALIAGSISGALIRKGMITQDMRLAFLTARRNFLEGIGFLALIALCLLAGLLIGGVRSAASLGYLHDIPAFLFNILLLRPYEGLCMLRAYGFRFYSEALEPGIVLGIILLIELLRPGIVTIAIARIAWIMIRAFQIKGPLKLHTSKGGLVAAVGAFAALLLMLYKRFREGWLSGEAVRRMLLISLKFMIIPLVLFIVAINIAYRKNLLNSDSLALPKDESINPEV